MISRSKAGAVGDGGPVVVEIVGVTAPATFDHLPDAVAAVWSSMRALPLEDTQYEAYKYFFTRPDAVERVTEFLQRDGHLSLSFSMGGRSHSVRLRPARPDVPS